MDPLARIGLGSAWIGSAAVLGLTLGALVHPLPASETSALLHLPALAQAFNVPPPPSLDILPPELSALPPPDSTSVPTPTLPRVIDMNNLQPRQLLDGDTPVSSSVSGAGSGVKVMRLTPEGTVSDEEFLPKGAASGTRESVLRNGR